VTAPVSGAAAHLQEDDDRYPFKASQIQVSSNSIPLEEACDLEILLDGLLLLH
jgi:hypothetical protein